MKKTEITYLLTGANLGDRFGTLEKANQLIEERIGKVTATSHFYETAAWGVDDQPDYLNQALEMETVLSPADILKEIHLIEEELGRVRKTKWGSRTIDIDILFYGDKILETNDLTLPHPRLHRRNFALIPMLDLAPELVHPVFNKSVEELYWECEDELEVILVELEENAPIFSPETVNS